MAAGGSSPGREQTVLTRFKRRSLGVCLEYKQHQANARCWRRFCKAVDQRLRATGGAGHKSSEERGDELLLAKASLLAESE